MPRFHYRAYDSSGQRVSGTIEAASEQEALQLLAARGLSVFETLPHERRRKLPFAGAASAQLHLSLQEWEEFLRELATFVQAGLLVEQALRLMAADARLPRVRRLAAALHERLMAGEALSVALRDLVRRSPPALLAVIGAAERSGRLAEALRELAALVAYENELRRRIMAASAYPAFLVLAAVVLVGLIATTLVPALLPLFEQANMPPPFFLQLLHDVQARLLRPQTMLWLALLLSAVWLLFAGAGGRMRRARLVLRLPWLGNLVQGRDVALYARTLATLLDNGLPLNEALRLAAEVMSNALLRSRAQALVQPVEEGQGFAQALTNAAVFPQIAVRFAQVGEDAGELAAAMHKLAEILESRTRQRMETLATLLGPVLIVAIGALIGAIIMAVMQAVMSINTLATR